MCLFQLKKYLASIPKSIQWMSASFRQGIVENATASERIARAQTIWPEDDDGHLVLTAFECDDGVLCLHFPGSSRLVPPMLDRLCHDVSRSIVNSNSNTTTTTQPSNPMHTGANSLRPSNTDITLVAATQY